MKKKELIKEWVSMADNDFRSAEYLTGMLPEPLEIICFHCQQAAEKMLKGYLVSLDIRPPKTHDLYELISLCSSNKRIDMLKESALVLNDYSIMVRYPGSHEITIEDKDEAVIAAEEFIRCIKDELFKSGDLSDL